jgi:hypothetical protein
MITFKTFINEARNPLRKQSSYIKDRTERQNILRQPSGIDVDDLEDQKVRITRQLEGLQDRIKRFERNKALRVELKTLDELTTQKQRAEEALEQIDYLINQELSREELPSFRRAKYPPGKKREPYKPAFAQNGIKWFIDPANPEKYTAFKNKLPRIMSMFFSALKERNLVRIPAANFIATPVQGAAIRDGVPESGAFLSHSIQIDPSKLNLRRSKDVEELLEIMLHEYAHLIFKKLPHDLKKPLGTFNRLYIKQLKAFKAKMPAEYRRFLTRILSSDDPRGRELRKEVAKFAKHPSDEGYAFMNPEELFAETFVFFKAQPQLFKTILNIINRYI